MEKHMTPKNMEKLDSQRVEIIETQERVVHKPKRSELEQ